MCVLQRPPTGISNLSLLAASLRELVCNPDHPPFQFSADDLATIGKSPPKPIQTPTSHNDDGHPGKCLIEDTRADLF